ncbi:hypothetical protein HK405_000743 [Cladochytrium tenue]|nr:hypothetical protein HK405_000743 [Cladochytrium tenue]
MTYVYDRYLFHYVQRNSIIFLCLAEDTFGRRIPFAFLDDVAAKFEGIYGPRAQTAIAYGLQEFAKYLATQMEYFSSNPAADRFRQVQGDLDHVKDVMVANIERVLERGERIDILVDKTGSLNQASFAFRKRSTALRRAMWWKNQKVVAAVAGTGVLLIYFALVLACGFPAFQSCSAS